MNFLDKLDLLMKEKNINRVDLAKGAKVPYTTIMSFYEKGYDNAKLSTLKKLSKYFKCSLDYLADDNINDKYYISKISEKDMKIAEVYLSFKNSDNEKDRALAAAVDHILGIDE